MKLLPALIIFATLSLVGHALADGPNWTPTSGTLSLGRYLHTATLLNNGKVLIAGGYNGTTYTASSELYDPATGKFTPTGSLNQARDTHTATLLPNGKVLVAGGLGASGVLNTAEIYDPATGNWTFTGNLVNARSYSAATLLPNGLVLLSGGCQNNSPPFYPQGASVGSAMASAELYDPSTGTWTATGSLHVARYFGSTTSLANGQVLVAGGLSNAGFATATNTVELYDSTTGIWTVTNPLHVGTFCHGATLLPNGQLLVVSGNTGNPPPTLTRCELYNPSTGIWSLTGNVAHARGLMVLKVLPSGDVLAASGSSGDNGGSNLTSSEIYHVSTGLWTPGPNVTIARNFPTATMLASGQILMACGFTVSVNAPPNTAELYTYGTGSLTATGSPEHTRVAPSTTLLPDGRVLLAGTLSGKSTHHSAELYDPASGTWSETGRMVDSRHGQTSVLLPSGKVLLAGGAAQAGELYDPATGTWAPTAPFSAASARPRAVLLANGTVLTVALESPSGTQSKVCDLYDPTSDVWNSTGASDLPPGPLVLLPDGDVLMIGSEYSRKCALYHPATGTWTITGGFIHPRGEASLVLLPNGKVLAIGGHGQAPLSVVAATELYDPATGTWSAGGNLAIPRYEFQTTLLGDGRVLIAGGTGSTGQPVAQTEIVDPATGLSTLSAMLDDSKLLSTTLLNSGQVLLVFADMKAELFDPGLGSSSASRPQLAAVPQVGALFGQTFTGTGFTGITDDAAGSDIPVVRLQSLGNNQVATLSVDPTQGFDSTFLASLPLGTFAPGYTRVTVFVNGTPSASQIALYSPQLGAVLTFSPVGAKAFGDPPFTLNASSPSDGSITYSVVSGPATISGNVVTLTGVGSVTLQASQAAHDIFGPLQAQQTIAVTPGAQTITFPVVPPQPLGTTLALNATASSGLPITYTHTGPVSIQGQTATFTGVGTVAIRAHQEGSANYLAAPSVFRIFNVVQATQTITFPAVLDQTVNSGPITLAATASSGLPISYTHSGPVKITGQTVTFTGTGKVTIRAYQQGNATYLAAPDKAISFLIRSSTAAAQTITFPPIGNLVVGTGPITLQATASSGLPITYRASGPVRISGQTLTVTGPGTAVISALQAGNVDFYAAPEVQQTIQIASSGSTVYSNTGGNLTGWIQEAGSQSYLGGGQFTPSSGFVPFTGATTDGSVITTAGYGSFYSLPVTAAGDFIMTFDVQSEEELSKQFGPAIFNLARTQFIWSYIGDSDDAMYSFTNLNDLSSGVRLSGIANNGPRLGSSVWHTMTLQRSGSLLTYSYDGAVIASHDFGTASTVGLGLIWAGDATFQIRNINVTVPVTVPAYNNTGGTLAGWTQEAGSLSYQGGAQFTPSSGFVPFTGATTDGSVITTAGYCNFYSLPVTAAGDFTMTFDVQSEEELSKQFGPAIFNLARTQFIWSYIGDSDDAMYSFTNLYDLSTGVRLSGIATNGPRLGSSVWHTMTLQRSGSLLTYSYDGVVIASHDFGTASTVGLGLIWAGDATFQIRNIKVTVP